MKKQLAPLTPSFSMLSAAPYNIVIRTHNCLRLVEAGRGQLMEATKRQVIRVSRGDLIIIGFLFKPIFTSVFGHERMFRRS